jgi:uncharacterized protein with ParB-like and HNH nuclease domain
MQIRKQHIPDIDFDRFPFGNIKNLFDNNKIYINYDYQRGDVWSSTQQIELITSIINSYSIGVLVLYINDKGQFEILDGQQRLLTINKYLNGKIPLKGTNITPYSKLETDEKIFMDAYSVGYLKLKSHNSETKEEDIIQTFLRLQEGSPLNKAEKLNAYRGKFKDKFKQIRETHNIFNLLGDDKRFKLRLLCAELLLLELEGDFKRGIFPGLDIHTFRKAIKKYETEISKNKLTFFTGNLDYLESSLGTLLTAITSRDLIPFYLLISYLRKEKADNSNLRTELTIFCEDFLQKVNSFSIYDTIPPKGMTKKEFNEYLNYKTEARKATAADSVEYRFNFMKKMFERAIPFIKKDTKRFHDTNQKRELFFRQKGKCPECNNPIDFKKDGSAHHEIAHKSGGKTDDLENAVLLHEKCHQKLEKRLLSAK